MNWSLCRTSACLVFLLAASTFYGQVSFFQPPAYLGSGILFTADFNGDGKADLLSGDGTLQLGNGDGTFTAGTPIAGTPLAVADFNGDGKADVLEQGTGTLLVLLGNGDGTFQPPITTAASTPFTTVAVPDLNGDHKADIVGISNGWVLVYQSNGDGTFFARSVNSFTGTAQTITLGDFNGDGKTDIAVTLSASTSARNIYVLLGNGDGTFQINEPVSSGVYTPPFSYVVAGDFNGDGKLDLVIGTSGCTPPNCSTATQAGSYFLAGNGNGTFQTPTLAIPNIYGAMVAEDVNGDGKTDLILQGASTAGQIYLGIGDGTFSNPSSYLLSFPGPNHSPFAPSLVTADFNKDGKLDVAMGNNVLLGNGDGTFQGIPLGVIPNDQVVLPSYLPAAAVLGQFNKTQSSPGAAVMSVSQSGTTASYNLNIFSNNGSGVLALAHTYALQEPGRNVVTADFNGDGNLDLLVFGIDPITQFWNFTVLLGNGDGSFKSPVLYAQSEANSGNQSNSVLVADFNNDKIPDVAIGGVGGQSLAVLIGKGDGTFAAPAYVFDGGDSTLSIADFNGDGNLDIAAGDNISPTPETAILLGKGDGTFQAAVFPSSLSGFVAGFSADLRNDGKADLIGGDEVALGNGDGTFTMLPPLPSGPLPLGPDTAIGVADLNGDGIPDLIAFEPIGSRYQQSGVLLGNGDGTFSATLIDILKPLTTAPSQALPLPLMIADLNGDGRPDIATVSLDLISGVAVLLNTSSANFGITATALSPSTVVAGASTSATISLTSSFGGAGAISLTCSGLPSGASCAFTPASVTAPVNTSSLVITTTTSTAAGTYPVVVQANAGSLSHQVTLSLVVQAASDFSITPPSVTSQSVTAGQSAMFTLSFSPVGTFSGTVTLGCTMAPSATPAPTCTLSSSSLQLSGTTAQTATLTVGTTAPVTSSARQAISHGGFPLASIPAVGLLGWLLLRKRKRLPMLVVLLIAATFTIGCSGGGSSTPPPTTTPGTPAGTYTATVSATSGTLTHTTTLQVVVQ